MRYTREVSRSLEAGDSPEIEVRTVNGRIRLRGEDRTDVVVHARASFIAPDNTAPDEIARAIEDSIYARGSRVAAGSLAGGNGFMSAIFDGLFRNNPNLTLDYEVAAPLNSSAELHVVSGEVDLTGINGDADVHVVHGDYRITDLRGDASVHAVNGHGTAARIGGDLDVQSTNGWLDVEGSAGDTSLRLLNGSVNVKDAGGDLSVSNVNGRIDVSGPVRGDISLTTTHGAIVLSVPAGSRFELDASSEMGSVASDLDVRERGEGEGSVPSVRLHSRMGSIRLRGLREAEAAFP